MDFNLRKLRKIGKCKPEESNEETGFDSLPKDVAFDILSRLPLSSVMNFRFVCRSWHNLSLDQNLASLHLSQAANHNPLLIFHSDNPIRNELCFAEFSGGDDDSCKGIVKKISIPFSASMPEFTVVGSCNGLLCLSDSLVQDAVYIYNPFTRDYKELPKTRQYEEQTVYCGFGYHPRTREYKVVKIVQQWIVNFADHYVQRRRIPGTLKSEILVFSLGGNTWRHVGLVQYYIERRSPEALITNGRVHWVAWGEQDNIRGLKIISFDLAEEKLCEIPRPDFSAIDGRNYHIAILKGCLSAAVFEHGLRRDMEIWVMKKYNVKESWIKEFKFRAYIPKAPLRKLQWPVRFLQKTFRKATLRVLCILKNGEILLEHKTGRLVMYDPERGKYKDVLFKGMPSMYEIVVHIGSLNQIDLPICN